VKTTGSNEHPSSRIPSISLRPAPPDIAPSWARVPNSLAGWPKIVINTESIYTLRWNK